MAGPPVILDTTIVHEAGPRLAKIACDDVLNEGHSKGGLRRLRSMCVDSLDAKARAGGHLGHGR